MIILDQAGAGAGEARFFSPPSALRDFVEHFWVQKVPPSLVGRAWRIVPDPNPHLIFVLSRKNSRMHTRCNLVGPRSHFADVAMANRLLTCGARLRPGALPIFTRFPASDFTDRSVAVEDVFGARGTSLMEQLARLKFPIRAVGVLSDFLNREFASHSRVLQFPTERSGRVKEMAATAGIPVRTLHSRMMQHVGLSPKRVIRIERLHRALVASQNRQAGWAQVAANSGFADQAHLIREFRDLLGESPTAWNRRSPSPSADLFKTASVAAN